MKNQKPKREGRWGIDQFMSVLNFMSRCSRGRFSTDKIYDLWSDVSQESWRGWGRTRMQGAWALSGTCNRRSTYRHTTVWIL